MREAMQCYGINRQPRGKGPRTRKQMIKARKAHWAVLHPITPKEERTRWKSRAEES